MPDDMKLLLTTAYEQYLQHLEERQCSTAHLETIGWRLGRYVKQHTDKYLATITAADLAVHFRELKEKGLAEATLAGHTRVHKAFWGWCKANRFIKKNPAKKLKNYSFRPKHRHAASPESVKRVIAALPNFARQRGLNQRDVRDALLVSLSLDCGGRLGEMWSLLRRDVQLALTQPQKTSNGLNVYHVTGWGKTGESELRFFEHTADLFRLWFEVSPRVPATAAVFINIKTGERLKVASLGRAFERICRYAKVPTFRSHAVRKRNISDMIRLSGSPNVGQRYANHADVATTMAHYDVVMAGEVDSFAATLANNRRFVHDDEDELAQLARLFGVKK